MPIQTIILLGLIVAERLLVIAERYVQSQTNLGRPEKAETILERLKRLRREVRGE